MFSMTRNMTQNPREVSTKGGMPTPTGVSDRQFSFAMDRSLIVRGWNGKLAAKINNNNNVAATPFRAVLNASDVNPSNCNHKYVFDSSVYSSYKRQVAKKHTFNKLK
jgi:hypothetical protein